MQYTPDLEYSVIGALCIDPRCFPTVCGKLTASDFQIRACGIVYQAASEIIAEGKPFDPVIATASLDGQIDDPESFIRNCMELCPTTANAELHAEYIHRNAAVLDLHDKINETLDTCDDDLLAETLAGICQDFLRGKTGKGCNMFELMNRMADALGEPIGKRLDTGFPRLDGILKGMWAGNLVLLGARPGCGKSAFGLDIARTVAQRGNKVMFFSLEMDREELAERWIANKGTVLMDSIIDRRFSDKQIKNYMDACSDLSGLPIIVEDEPNLTVAKIRSKARAQTDVDLIIVDYIGLMQSTKKYENRNLEVGAISRELKNLASELHIPILALSQLKRDRDPYSQPSLSDLRDSGELEQNANKVLFIWNVDEEQQIVGVSVAKNRRGKTGAVQMKFQSDFMRFIEMAEDIPTPGKNSKRGTSRYDDDDD